MSDEERDSKWQFVGIASIVCVALITILLVLNSSTVEEYKVPADCNIIMNDVYEMPDDVITKGYDVERNDIGQVIDFECYYIKDAGLIHAYWYGWEFYQ